MVVIHSYSVRYNSHLRLWHTFQFRTAKIQNATKLVIDIFQQVMNKL